MFDEQTCSVPRPIDEVASSKLETDTPKVATDKSAYTRDIWKVGLGTQKDLTQKLTQHVWYAYNYAYLSV